MTIETLTKIELASILGYAGADGNSCERAIAQFMRDALERWGLCTRKALFRHARDQLDAGGLSTEAVPKVLKRLIALGECEEVTVGHEVYVAPAEPRWMACGNGQAVLLGATVVPSETPRLNVLHTSDITVRVHLEGDEQAAILFSHGVREVSLAEWLHPLGFLRHVVRRAGHPVRSDQCDLATFWASLNDALCEEGLPLSAEAEVRAVVGEPGGFFGKYTAPIIEGRWVGLLPDGVWCAYRRGYGDSHWLPILVSCDGDERRSIDLFDNDEWRWAFLARSRAVGPAEVYRRSGCNVAVTWPLPNQLRAAMDIIGTPSGSWQWRIAEDAPDLWTLLR